MLERAGAEVVDTACVIELPELKVSFKFTFSQYSCFTLFLMCYSIVFPDL